MKQRLRFYHYVSIFCLVTGLGAFSKAAPVDCGPETTNGTATWNYVNVFAVDASYSNCTSGSLAATVNNPVQKSCTNSNTGQSCTVTWTEVYNVYNEGGGDLGECSLANGGGGIWAYNTNVDESSCDATSSISYGSQPYFCSPDYSSYWWNTPKCY